MNIEIKAFEDLEGKLQTALTADKLELEDLMRLGPVLGRLITMNVGDRTNMMAVLKQIYTSAGWQIVLDTGSFITESEDELSGQLLDSFIDDAKDKGVMEQLFLH